MQVNYFYLVVWLFHEHEPNQQLVAVDVLYNFLDLAGEEHCVQGRLLLLDF
jgi:hypothetical protein